MSTKILRNRRECPNSRLHQLRFFRNFVAKILAFDLRGSYYA